jgi:hypothetical protein
MTLAAADTTSAIRHHGDTVGERNRHVTWNRADAARRTAGRDRRSRRTVALASIAVQGCATTAARSIRPIRNPGADEVSASESVGSLSYVSFAPIHVVQQNL